MEITEIQKDILFLTLDFLEATKENLGTLPELFIGDPRFKLIRDYAYFRCTSNSGHLVIVTEILLKYLKQTVIFTS
jgi:hypothetical protein